MMIIREVRDELQTSCKSIRIGISQVYTSMPDDESSAPEQRLQMQGSKPHVDIPFRPTESFVAYRESASPRDTLTAHEANQNPSNSVILGSIQYELDPTYFD